MVKRLKRVEDSAVYLAEILSNGKVGRRFVAYVNGDSIYNMVTDGVSLDRARENVEQNAIEVAIRELSPPVADDTEVQIIGEEDYLAFQKA